MQYINKEWESGFHWFENFKGFFGVDQEKEGK